MNTAYSYEIQPLDEYSISIERVYGTTPVVVIPEQIDGFTVKRIGAYCFSESKHVPAVSNYTQGQKNGNLASGGVPYMA